MRVPGRAWLSWTVVDDDPEDGRIELHQVAEFAPRGLWGRAYWWAMLPFHWAIFARMARSITRFAETTGPNGTSQPAEVARAARPLRRG